MSWYRLIKDYDDAPAFRVGESKLFGEVFDDVSTPKEPFLEGKDITNWDARDSYIKSVDAVDDLKLLDVEFLFAGFVAMLSHRLMSALRSAGIAHVDVQYLPLRVFHSTGHEEPSTWLANVLGRVNGGLDVTRSKLITYEDDVIDPITNQPKISVIGKPVLKSAIVSRFEGDIFRLAEYPDKIFVSERFVSLYKQVEFTGAYLAPVEMV